MWILVLEDHPTVQKGLMQCLTQLGYAPILATDVSEARRRFQEHSGQFAAITLDGSPDGVDAWVRELRANGYAGGLFAASEDPYRQEELVKAGCHYRAEKTRLPDMVQQVMPLKTS